MSTTSIPGVVPRDRRRSLAPWTVLAAQLMLQMDFLIVIVALPRIQHDLGFSAAALSWVPNAFALSFGGLLLLGGRLGDIFGQVRLFRTGLAVFVLSSLAGGFAQSAELLIAARVVQGIGAALAGPSVLALVSFLSRNEVERTRGLSLFIAVSSIGASAGLILGGVLTEFISWRWSFLINVPVGLSVLALVGRLVPETRPTRARLDVMGAIAATLGSAGLVYGFIHAGEFGWSSKGTAAPFMLAVALITAFVRIEVKHPEPLLDLSLLRNGQRTVGLAVMALIVGMHFSLIFMLVQYLQRVLSFSPLGTGLAYIPLTATVFVITHFVPRLIQRFGAGMLLVAGSVLVAVSFGLFARMDASGNYFPSVFLPLVMHAVGIALVFAPGTVAILHEVPAHQSGAASGLLQMDQQIGGALGIAAIAAVYALGSQPGAFVPGIRDAFYAAAAIAVIAALLAAVAPWGSACRPPST
jgi:EmrB/QacA subfamily drug resistance transporter